MVLILYFKYFTGRYTGIWNGVALYCPTSVYINKIYCTYTYLPILNIVLIGTVLTIPKYTLRAQLYIIWYIPNNTHIGFYYTGRDLIPFTITFVSCLIFDVEMGLLFGICVDLLCVLYRSARPSISIEKETVSSHKT